MHRRAGPGITIPQSAQRADSSLYTREPLEEPGGKCYYPEFTGYFNARPKGFSNPPGCSFCQAKAAVELFL